MRTGEALKTSVALNCAEIALIVAFLHFATAGMPTHAAVRPMMRLYINMHIPITKLSANA